MGIQASQEVIFDVSFIYAQLRADVADASND